MDSRQTKVLGVSGAYTISRVVDIARDGSTYVTFQVRVLSRSLYTFAVLGDALAFLRKERLVPSTWEALSENRNQPMQPVRAPSDRVGGPAIHGRIVRGSRTLVPEPA